MAMRGNGFSETACAILALTTRIAFSPEMPLLMPRSVVRRMLNAGAIQGLVLRDTPGIEEKWFERAEVLLSRVGEVAECMVAYQAEGYMLLLDSDQRWPLGLGALGLDEPLFLYINGNQQLLDKRMISVAGSRQILAQTQNAALRTGELIAQSGATLVTGGASGTDTWAQRGTLQTGGGAVIVPAMPAARVMENALLRDRLEQGQVLLVCDTLPDEPFSANKALSRNHTIYAMGDASLVVAAREGQGGSWRGATDCMRGNWSPVYVWNGRNADTAGNRALEKRGAGSYSLDKPIDEQLVIKQQTNMFEGMDER